MTKFLTYKGRSQTHRGWASELGITVDQFKYRLKVGIEFAMNPEKVKPKNRTYTYNGETLKHNEWAQRLGISYEALRSRVEKLGIDGALEKGSNNHKRLISHNGELKTPQEWADHLGVTAGYIRRRLKKMPVEQALTLCMDKDERFMFKVCRFGVQERNKSGKPTFRTEHLEQYLRQSWNPHITIPDHAGRWYEPVAEYPDEVPGTGEVLGCAA